VSVKEYRIDCVCADAAKERETATANTAKALAAQNWKCFKLKLAYFTRGPPKVWEPGKLQA
jgi:hypothetical protein